MIGIPIATEDLVIKLGSYEDADQAAKEKALKTIINVELMH
ncbi:MAG: hypothetical protein M0Z89_08945 [Nitrospiraceae bacterium]|nr:hypothetical protein [Nitrospiraceae bacterium]